MGGRTERAHVEEEPIATADFVERAFEPERAVTPLDVDESHETGWPRLPRIASPRVTPRATPAEPREFVFVSGASVVLPPPTSEPAPTRRRQRRRAHRDAANDLAPGDERRRRDRRRRRRRKPKGVSPLASPTSSLNFPDWASPTSSIASSLSEALSSPWSSPRPHLGEQHHFPRGDSSSSSFWSSTSSLWSSTTSSLRSWASSSSASSLLSFAAAPAQGDGPDHYRPDSPDDFRVACRDVSMPLPE